MITSLLRALLSIPNKKSQELGSQRSLAMINTYNNQYDLEIEEYPLRDIQKARQLIELNEYCYEVKHCLITAGDDAFASSDGDDVGFTISDTVDDNETKINPEVFAIADDVIKRKQSFSEYLIGGTKLKRALQTTLIYGDCFLSLEIDLKNKEVSRSLYLPTWEMFRIEDNQGYLEAFEQRRFLTESEPTARFYPFQIVHLRKSQKFLYGRSLWDVSLEYWIKYKEATANLARACKDESINPIVHKLPIGWNATVSRQYQSEYESKRKEESILVDLYESSGVELRRLGVGNSSLQSHIDTLLQWRYMMIPSGFPLWMFPGLEFKGGAKELSRSPDRRYSRMRYGWCQLLSEAIKQVIDTEIVLKKGWDFYEQEVLKGNGYRIIWSEWSIDGMEDNDESNKSNIDDLDEEGNENQATINRYHLISNGNGQVYS